MNKRQKNLALRLIIAAVALIALNIINPEGWLRPVLFGAVYLTVAVDVLKNAFLGITAGRIFSEEFLMAVASLGAFALALFSGSGDYNEAVTVMLLFQAGELLQALAVRKSRKNIAALMDIRPDSANIERDGTLISVDPETVGIGSIIVVRPGEKIPIDGVITEGSGSLDTAALTGESVPRDVSPGDRVISGCICQNGVLKIKTECEYSQSTVAKILELTENASWNKSKSEDFITKFARYYTPAVCFAALALAFLPPLFSLLLTGTGDFAKWIYRALTFLVISCPCALVISVPLTFFASIGGASRQGILFKGSNYIEALASANIAVFDKTGTLTEGILRVHKIEPFGVSKSVLLETAALCECNSTHPVAKALLCEEGNKLDRSRVSDIKEIAGKGVTAVIDGKPAAVGNRLLMESLSLKVPETESEGTVVHVALDGNYIGYIALADLPKKDAARDLHELKKAGISQSVMLTGDNEITARSLAYELGIDSVFSELLPEDKVIKVEELLKGKKKGTTLFYVGDGINDAPVLARADVGIAMGALGTDAAIEAADVVLMDDSLQSLVTAVSLSKKCRTIVTQNISFTLLIKFSCLLLGALGIAGMPVAIFADVGVMLLAILNSLRALV